MQLSVAELAALNANQTVTISPPSVSSSAPADLSLNLSVRPPGNTGKGFYVANGLLHDVNNIPFRIRGVNRCHYDSDAATPAGTGIYKSGANTVRIGTYLTSVGAAEYAKVCQNHLDAKQVPILALFRFPDGTVTSGNADVAQLAAGVAWWVANVGIFGAMPNLIINLANEWGPTNSATWFSAYRQALMALRAAGYTNTVMIDTGGYGQDMADLLVYAATLAAADSQKNVIFGFHLYGNTPSVAAMAMFFNSLLLWAAQGLVFVISEFGPGNNIGPSPTMITPDEVIAAAEAAGLGWMAWAWDDNNLANGASNDQSFSMTLAGPGTYTVPADLTPYGADIVAQLAKLATPASIFL